MGDDGGNLDVEYGGGYYDPLQKEYYDQVYAGLQDPKISKGRIPELTDLERAGIAGTAALGHTEQAQTRRNTLGGMITEDLPFDISPEIYERYYRENIEAPARFAHEDNIQQILHQFGSTGGTGRVIDELGRSTTALELGLAGQRSGIAMRGMEREQDFRMDQRMALPEFMKASRAEEAFGPTMEMEAGGYLRQFQQSKNNQRFFNQLMEESQNNPWLGHMQGAMNSQPMPMYSSGGDGGGGPGWGAQNIPIVGGIGDMIYNWFV